MEFDFWTSDLHFGHVRISELAKRPFTSVEEMNLGLVRNWNSVVSPGDRVAILGDLCMGKFADTVRLLSLLNGEKFLCPGNHDRVHPSYTNKVEKMETWAGMYRENGISFLPIEFDAEIDGISVRCCHFPYVGDHMYEERYTEWRPKDDGRFVIHGHVHGEWKIRDRMVNVGVDVWDYTPVSNQILAEILRDKKED